MRPFGGPRSGAKRPLLAAWRVGTIVAGASLVILVLAMAATSLPRLAGFTPYVVMSGSMEPDLSIGDVAVVRRTDPSTLKAGDVITYKSGGRTVTHRIVGIELGSQGSFFLTQGDANQSLDRQRVSPEAIEGKMRYSLPAIGFVIAFANSLAGMALLIFAPAAALAVMTYREHRARTAAAGSPQVEAGRGA